MTTKSKIKARSHTRHFVHRSANAAINVRGSEQHRHEDGSTDQGVCFLNTETPGVDQTTVLDLAAARKLRADLDVAIHVAETVKPCESHYCYACKRMPTTEAK